jgi:hypothetical protein
LTILNREIGVAHGYSAGRVETPQSGHGRTVQRQLGHASINLTVDYVWPLAPDGEQSGRKQAGRRTWQQNGSSGVARVKKT